MDKAKEALKAELLELYSQALDEMLETCPEQEDFAVLEERVEQLARQTLPETLSKLAQERGIFPPDLSSLPKTSSEKR
ncbi:MAG: hypothetical protein Q7T22_08065 [Serpentinimonas sp.]|jgi:hypothetical protein|nr:hypothetical protein [Truepera sp.]MDO8275459.1 hypothetical protein [Serpentinimonas sp.]